MNIQVGDTVSCKINSSVTGIVRKILFFHETDTQDCFHLVVFYSGHGYMKYKEPKYLTVIKKRRFK